MGPPLVRRVLAPTIAMAKATVAAMAVGFMATVCWPLQVGGLDRPALPSQVHAFALTFCLICYPFSFHFIQPI